MLDPAIDAACDKSIWRNVTNALKDKGVRLGWLTRSCSDIMDASGVSAGYDCRGGRPGPIRKGTAGVVHSNLLDETEQVFKNRMARMEMLHSRGVDIL